MRLFGHPLHVMLIHFPVALWPAHAALHFFAGVLPPAASAVVGFWLLATGVGLGWLAALCGAADLLALDGDKDPGKFNAALLHALLNGSTLVGFTVLLALEFPRYPAIAHGRGFLFAEAALLVLLFVGNYFGGAVVWRKSPPV
jgi:uncharacterized membrane protein